MKEGRSRAEPRWSDPLRSRPTRSESRRVERHREEDGIPEWWKAPRSPRNRRLSRGGGGRRSRPASRTEQGALQPLRTARHGDPGARERKPEEGHWSFSTSPSLAAPGPFVRREAWVSAHGQRRAKGSFFTGDPGSIAQARRKPAGAGGSCVGDSRAAVVDTRERGGGDREDRGSPVRHGRGSAARGMCPWVVSGCRSRRASPTVQRSRDLLFLNRTRSSRTGPSARRAEPRTRKGRWPTGRRERNGDEKRSANVYESRAVRRIVPVSGAPKGVFGRRARIPDDGRHFGSWSTVAFTGRSGRSGLGRVRVAPFEKEQGGCGDGSARGTVARRARGRERPTMRREGKEERDPPKRAECREALRSSKRAEPLRLRRGARTDETRVHEVEEK